jgi:hypothetical protein
MGIPQMKTPRRRKIMKFTAVFQKVAEGYIAFVEELPGATKKAACRSKPPAV